MTPFFFKKPQKFPFPQKSQRLFFSIWVNPVLRTLHSYAQCVTNINPVCVMNAIFAYNFQEQQFCKSTLKWHLIFRLTTFNKKNNRAETGVPKNRSSFGCQHAFSSILANIAQLPEKSKYIKERGLFNDFKKALIRVIHLLEHPKISNSSVADVTLRSLHFL